MPLLLNALYNENYPSTFIVNYSKSCKVLQYSYACRYYFRHYWIPITFFSSEPVYSLSALNTQLDGSRVQKHVVVIIYGTNCFSVFRFQLFMRTVWIQAAP